ncbi:hypothetical protein KGP36_02865 [Patescibacteria group bacterium]|nr:hypothetical protein [Patescibacteria group bacterium]
MKRLFTLVSLSSVVVFLAGCAITRTPTVTANPNGGFTTNVVVSVNQTALSFDCLAVQAVVSLGAQQVVQHDPNSTAVIHDIERALSSTLSGANHADASTIIGLVGASNASPVTQSQITQLVQYVSNAEQALIQKYGVTVAGQVTLAIVKSVLAGLTQVVPL